MTTQAKEPPCRTGYGSFYVHCEVRRESKVHALTVSYTNNFQRKKQSLNLIMDTHTDDCLNLLELKFALLKVN